MSIPTPFNPLGTLDLPRTVTLGPYAPADFERLPTEGECIRARTTVGAVTFVAEHKGASTPEQLLALNTAYKPPLPEPYINANSGYIRLLFSSPVRPLRLSFNKVYNDTSRILYVSSTEGVELGNSRGVNYSNFTIDLTADGRVNGIVMRASNSFWLNGITLDVEI